MSMSWQAGEREREREREVEADVVEIGGMGRWVGFDAMRVLDGRPGICNQSTAPLQIALPG